MFKHLCILILSLWLLCISYASASAAARGPAYTFEELQNLLLSAREGDVITIADDIVCQEPLTSAISVRITSHGEAASLHGLQLEDAHLTFSNIRLTGSLIIGGRSSVHLRSGTQVSGSDGQCGLIFQGSGLLLADRGSTITGGSGACGVSINHNGGELYASFEGTVCGGSGHTGGVGVYISPLESSGVIMLSGKISGGQGNMLGGHAINLYNLSGNAFVTVDGSVVGGAGSIGGDGLQIVSVSNTVNVGVAGKIKGGEGSSYGGDAIMLMDVSGASTLHLSGEFVGGDARGAASQPGTSLVMVGDTTNARAHVNDCLLLDGSRILSSEYIAPQITPLPGITSSTNAIAVLESGDTLDNAP